MQGTSVVVVVMTTITELSPYQQFK